MRSQSHAVLLMLGIVVAGAGVVPAEDRATPTAPATPAPDPAAQDQEDLAAERRLQEALADQMRVQGDLLTQMEEHEEAPVLDDSLSLAIPEQMVLDQSDPRTAPSPPPDRQLPDEIFEQEFVTVPAGTWGMRKKRRLIKRTLDADGDGKPELIRYIDPESKLMVRQEEDTNYDGLIDTWSNYEWGAVVTRVRDSNDDGNPDVWERYDKERMTSREIDRDDDGVRDAFYRYEGGELTREEHDASNDGKIDLRIVYGQKRRVSAEEDQDRDGNMDTWTTYTVVEGAELIVRIERDTKARGFPDTFETFEAKDGKALLARREEDLNGDGKIDVLSIYRNGKLVKREISDPSLVNL